MNISYYNNYNIVISYTCLYLFIYYSSVIIYEYSLSALYFHKFNYNLLSSLSLIIET